MDRRNLRRVRWRSALLTTIGLVLASTSTARAATPADDDRGRRLYLTHCAFCHGSEGKGDGPDAAVFGEKPRDLRSGFLSNYTSDDLVRRIREGVPLMLALDVPALDARARQTDALVSHLQRLPKIDWSSVLDGWAIYIQRCERCHGRYGRPSDSLPGGVSPPRDLSSSGFQRSVTDKQLSLAVRHGRKGMPALARGVAAGDTVPLTKFVRVLSPGFQLYSQYCSSCHGDNGEGSRHPLGSIGMPTVVFDAHYFAEHDPEQVRRSAWHMFGQEKPAMVHFKWSLSEPEVRAIVDYLKTWH